jgi:biotin operon repressor
MAKATENKQHMKVLSVLLSGEFVSKEQMETLLGKTVAFYRISTYIWKLRKREGALIEARRDGKNVAGYILTNPEKFAALQGKAFDASPVKLRGRAAGEGKRDPKPVKVKAVKPAKAPKAPVVDGRHRAAVKAGVAAMKAAVAANPPPKTKKTLPTPVATAKAAAVKAKVPAPSLRDVAAATPVSVSTVDPEFDEIGKDDLPDFLS